MSINLPEFTADVNAHQNLADQPALSANELKQAWDQPASDIKNYLNNTLLPQIQTQVGNEIANGVTEAKNYADSAVEGITLSASDISYNKTTSGLNANNVQRAIDLLDATVDSHSTNITALRNSLSNWIKTQTFTGSATQNGYSRTNINLGTLSVPSGYTYIGVITTNNSNPTKVSSTYEVSGKKLYVWLYNYSDTNDLTTTIKSTAIFIKDSIS